MVIDNFHLMRAVCLPAETKTPLVVDADGELALAIAFEGFQPVARRNAELKQFRDGVKLGKLPQGRALDVRRKGADLLQPEQAGGILAGKGTDHASWWVKHNA